MLTVWNMFGCKNFGDYLMLYIKTDVILLAHVFEKCRRLFDQVYGLDPCHYYSASNISWDAMLKTTEVKLDMLSDIDMLLFCEGAIRGLNGIGEKRYMKANNKYLDDFDEEKPSTFGLFLDVVNLYGGTMMKNCQPDDLNGQTSVWTKSCKHLRNVMFCTFLWLT